MTVLNVVWIALAGGVGASARFVVDGLFRGSSVHRVPAGTLVVNLTGSLLFGVVSGLVLFHSAPSELSVVLGTGLCGGYTTFSAASYESIRQVQVGRAWPCFIISGVHLVGCLSAAAVGLAITAA